MDHLNPLRPFGHGFEEPVFKIEARIMDVRFYNDKESGQPKHTAVFISGPSGRSQKIMFFNEVHPQLEDQDTAQFLVTALRQNWQGKSQLTFIGQDFACS